MHAGFKAASHAFKIFA